MDAMAAVKQTFFQECEEQLAELETGLLAMERGEAESDTVNAVFRAVHSIKGGAGAFSLEGLVQFAHVFETTLDHVRNGALEPTADVMAVMLRAADLLADLVAAARDGHTVDSGRSEVLVGELTALSPGGAEAEAEEEDDMSDFSFTPVTVAFDFSDAPVDIGRSYTITFKPRPELYAKGNETVLVLRELERLGELEINCDASGLPSLAALDPEGAYLEWTIKLTTEKGEDAIREVFEFVEWDSSLTIQAADAGSSDAEPGADSTEDAFAALLRSIQGDEAAQPATTAEIIPLPSAEEREAVAEVEAQPTKAAAARNSESGANANAGAPQTIRADLERVDRLIDLVGELVINQAMLSQRVMEAGHVPGSAVALGLDELEHLTREIQDCVMAIRAQAVKSVFQRIPRLVREVASMTGKQVRLITDGEGTEVDKTVIDRLNDPLTHMIRNAIDHGLEKPEVRIAAGKPAEGVVRLSAMHRSGRIVIEVADDGAGINRSRVKAIAVEKGLIAADAVLSDEEIDNLIFLPGFSTASEVSNISGRGVGMDVVKRSIQGLGGRLSITSRPGKGSTFTMSLPLTLAVLDGMVVTVADQTLVVPLTAIIETLQPKAADVHGLGGGSRVIAIRDAFTPLIDVGRELGFRNTATDPLAGVAILVETEGGRRSALLVDTIQGQRQVVIKSLESNYRHVPGIAAATILGDGRVALIIDVDTVIANSQSDATILEPVLAAAG
ncbi:chemotaxis protein CheA [Aminobacter sp. NyZ550]|uniref:Chemotaxis protein CheA n=1 Tax=Aminobacter ciceronei TaxID=150723 RepID=A0ABR6CIT8_9HYPH|nr:MULTISPECIES: chemotaxis protein CheA [Aminobacter]MBA8910526.1 two-component system chemotaxis sensor kinase CheA [Aminobacter ciceronei]MBA9024297.1 two-component system chemotaxis sensor kinase CheA [Aminobacter ciceronei]WAX97828.1 chemotaxis protein CheA [Aminobacter sp. NyZ550]WMC97180.1 chemotaxis protein CheA [Aminobacter aminovorans]